ncbi:MAG: 50S ribosomal protein L23 [Planctomycetes bacterium]|nr:50S ribosomal protein L23 [Planctomycetota bacterium]
MNAYEVIRRPIVTEKAVHLSQRRRQYAFEVAPDATKRDIQSALEEIYRHKKLEVLAVRTMRLGGKTKRDRRSGSQGVTREWKKALVTLAEGQTIDLF